MMDSLSNQAKNPMGPHTAVRDATSLTGKRDFLPSSLLSKTAAILAFLVASRH